MSTKTVLVTGAGGFIGGHLTKSLVEKGHNVRAVDIKPIDQWYQKVNAENIQLDLRYFSQAERAMNGVTTVYNLAANMGGIGFIERNKFKSMLSVYISANLLQLCIGRVEKYFYASSACVYNKKIQSTRHVIPLKESNAYPAYPEDGYGWEKLFSEHMAECVAEEYGLDVRIARFHNVYGPYGAWNGGREKAPAAICRKVIEAKLKGINTIELWGDGEQLRTFMYIDDCVEGIHRLMNSEVRTPINLGSAEVVSINQLVDLVEEYAGIKLTRKYNLAAPQGVMSRSSDNTFIKQKFGWEPSTPLREGIKKTYDWIINEYQAAH